MMPKDRRHLQQTQTPSHSMVVERDAKLKDAKLKDAKLKDAKLKKTPNAVKKEKVAGAGENKFDNIIFEKKIILNRLYQVSCLPR